MRRRPCSTRPAATSPAIVCSWAVSSSAAAGRRRRARSPVAPSSALGRLHPRGCAQAPEALRMRRGAAPAPRSARPSRRRRWPKHSRVRAASNGAFACFVPLQRLLEVRPVVVSEQTCDPRCDRRAPGVPGVPGPTLEGREPAARRLEPLRRAPRPRGGRPPTAGRPADAGPCARRARRPRRAARAPRRGCPRPSASRPRAAPVYSAITARRLRAAISSACSACSAAAGSPVPASTIASTPRL